MCPFETVDENDENHVLKQYGKREDDLGWDILFLCPPSKRLYYVLRIWASHIS